MMSSFHGKDGIMGSGSPVRDTNPAPEPQSARDSQDAGRPVQTFRLLVISSRGELSALLREWLDGTHWQVLGAQKCDAAMATWSERQITVVLCDCPLPDGHWQDFFRLTASQPVPPSLVVASRLADCRLWAGVLSAGGYDLLLQPLEREEALRVISAAAQEWKKRQDSEKSRPRSE